MARQTLVFLRLPLRFKILIDRKSVRKNNNVFIYPDKKKKNQSAEHRGTAGINGDQKIFIILCYQEDKQFD